MDLDLLAAEWQNFKRRFGPLLEVLEDEYHKHLETVREEQEEGAEAGDLKMASAAPGAHPPNPESAPTGFIAPTREQQQGQIGAPTNRAAAEPIGRDAGGGVLTRETPGLAAGASYTSFPIGGDPQQGNEQQPVPGSAEGGLPQSAAQQVSTSGEKTAEQLAAEANQGDPNAKAGLHTSGNDWLPADARAHLDSPKAGEPGHIAREADEDKAEGKAPAKAADKTTDKPQGRRGRVPRGASSNRR